MNQTETSLARIFAICDQVAETGEPVRTEGEAKEAGRVWLGETNKLDAFSEKWV